MNLLLGSAEPQKDIAAQTPIKLALLTEQTPLKKIPMKKLFVISYLKVYLLRTRTTIANFDIIPSRPLGSVVERFIHIEKVRGSIPLAATIKNTF